MRIALDAMGGDHGPRPAVEGAVAAVRRLGIEVVLVGRARYLERLIAAIKVRDSRIHLVDAPDIVTMEDSPKESLRKRQSSLAVSAELVRKGDCQAFVSAGNTGAVHAHALLSLRTLPGIKKPAIATLLPTYSEPVVVLDAGANVDCKPRQLVNFAIMGHVYAREVLRRANPRVGLLNIGEEETKGNELTIEVGRILRSTKLNFLGNAEGRDVFSGDYDVIVCDGFVGNVLLKCAEGCAQFAMQSIKREVRKSLLTLIGAVMMKPALRRFRRRVDYDEYGGAPLLGTNGVCIICHGKSNTKAFKNALRVAREAVSQQLNQHILEELNRHSYLTASWEKSVADLAASASSPEESADPESLRPGDSHSIPHSSSEVSVQ